MNRREVITLIGGAVTMGPLAARAQQPAMPVIGHFNSGKSAAQTTNVAAFHLGLKEEGFVDGRNVAIEYQWGENQFGRLPALAADLVKRPVTVIVANLLAARHAKAATGTIPIVFITGSDPVRDGLVTSLNRPGGNVTGTVFITGELGTKRLELLRQLVPNATSVAMFVNPDTPETEGERRDAQAAARAFGLQLDIHNVSSSRDIDASFATLVARGAGALLVGAGAFLFNSREQIVALAARHALPAMYPQREAVAGGGLMSYGTSATDAYRQAGIYAGRILKGERPADLPVMRSTKFEFVVNLKTANALNLTISPTLLALTDEVIE
jgi:putative tryptophan/tyrosine transport system substrate-binding protein